MLKNGDHIPDISLAGSDGTTHHLNSYNGQPMVIYFYPKNETPGCIAEACAFRDQFEEFESVGAKVIGISMDSVSSHQRFIKNRRLPFLLLSDPERIAERAFGVPRRLLGLLPGRVTFIVNEEGIIIHTFDSSINPIKHIKIALQILKEHANES